jgi:hypothetical protein
MTGVQLIGKKLVMDSYSALDCDCWALYQGKQFIVSGCGVDDLDRWLTSFEASGTTATYLIRVYDCETPPTSSTANADYVACVSFKLVDTYQGMGIAGHNNGLMERIKGIEKKLDEREEDQEGEEGMDLNAIITGWLTDPAKLAQVAGVIRMFTGGGGAAIETAPAAIQGIGAVSPGPAAQEAPAVDLEKLAAALDILGAKDPKLVEHLEKLAKLATNEPELFKSVISKIDLL